MIRAVVVPTEIDNVRAVRLGGGTMTVQGAGTVTAQSAGGIGRSAISGSASSSAKTNSRVFRAKAPCAPSTV